VSLIPRVCKTVRRLSDLAGFLPLFEVNDEAQPSPRGQRQVLLGDAQVFARILISAPICWGVIFIVRILQRDYRTGI
jgi:hypothetical protein